MIKFSTTKRHYIVVDKEGGLGQKEDLLQRGQSDKGNMTKKKLKMSQGVLCPLPSPILVKIKEGKM